MKIGKITRASQKGQIVIPKEYRDALHVREGTPLHISLKGSGIYIQPVHDIIHEEGNKEMYLKILDKTKGAWKDDDWEETEKQRRKIELAASKRRKAW